MKSTRAALALGVLLGASLTITNSQAAKLSGRALNPPSTDEVYKAIDDVTFDARRLTSELEILRFRVQTLENLHTKELAEVEARLERQGRQTSEQEADRAKLREEIRRNLGTRPASPGNEN